jgi:hypothetical protein
MMRVVDDDWLKKLGEICFKGGKKCIQGLHLK